MANAVFWKEFVSERWLWALQSVSFSLGLKKSMVKCRSMLYTLRTAQKLVWDLQRQIAKHSVCHYAEPGAYERRSHEGACNHGSNQIQITYVFPLCWCICLHLRFVKTTQQKASHNEGGSPHLAFSRQITFAPSLAHNHLAILPPLQLVCNFSPCYRRTRVFLCRHCDAWLNIQLPYLEVHVLMILACMSKLHAPSRLRRSWAPCWTCSQGEMLYLPAEEVIFCASKGSSTISLLHATKGRRGMI